MRAYARALWGAELPRGGPKTGAPHKFVVVVVIYLINVSDEDKEREIL